MLITEVRNQVPYCGGRNFPNQKIPLNACDCHHHIYDPVRFPYISSDKRNQPPADVNCYQLLKNKLGITRDVIVQPSAYGLDNRCTLDALKQLGKKNARAIVVINNSISDEELKSMDELGVKGIRLNMTSGYVQPWDDIQLLVKRIAPMGWNVCLWVDADLLVEKKDFFEALPVQLILDHRGNLPAGVGIKHPAFRQICKWLDQGKAWVKLSGYYFGSQKEDFSDTIEIGKEYAKSNPNRLLWGTDWPHPLCYTNGVPCPDDSLMLDQLMEQVGDEKIFYKTLVENPAHLFKFE
ncbi:amidohydrolase family protein [Acidaminococcus sp. NSJ-142]|uniref:amidohydrolase family protein n=1 Tax=Acidaminococcus hominis TaxID=2897706 RepID=UPI001E622903|nr:amidohydrolase family protein [Acidaminococcus hominis]MCD2436576.1 amidohydrolase family protein [Acidaminococcus hominis]